MSKVLVLGHQNPDSDAIGSSVAYAYLKREFGVDTEAVALGTPNEETTFALNCSDVEAPRVVKSVKVEGADQVILTGHNEFQQSISDTHDVEVIEIIDHHRVADFGMADPLYTRLKPVSPASSIVYRLYKENNVVIPKGMVGLSLSGLISDTLLLKSSTIHATDPAVTIDLAGIAGINLEEYGLALLEAGTNLVIKPAEELIGIDTKTFEPSGNQIRVAQVDMVDTNEVPEHQAEIEAATTAANTANGYSDFVLMTTDILNSDSEILALGSNIDKVEAAFDFRLESNHAFPVGAVSRKKQVVPQLTGSFNV